MRWYVQNLRLRRFVIVQSVITFGLSDIDIIYCISVGRGSRLSTWEIILLRNSATYQTVSIEYLARGDKKHTPWFVLTHGISHNCCCLLFHNLVNVIIIPQVCGRWPARRSMRTLAICSCTASTIASFSATTSHKCSINRWNQYVCALGKRRWFAIDDRKW